MPGSLHRNPGGDEIGIGLDMERLTVTAVSYTHLDLMLAASSLEALILPAAIRSAESVPVLMLDALMPVSYTHLDVYKRQVVDSALVVGGSSYNGSISVEVRSKTVA